MNHSTPKQCSASEVHELRYRISQLEHLIVTSSLNGSNLNATSSLPSNSTLLQTPHGLIGRMTELEGLLAASEHENEGLRHALEQLTIEKNRGEVTLLEKLYAKDTELQDVGHSYKLVQVKLDKALKKLEGIQDYINGLPSQDELDEANAKVSKLQEDNVLLEKKLEKVTETVGVMQREKIGLENQLREAQLRLEELSPLAEAEEAFIKDGDLSTLDLNDVESVQKTLTLQKAQLLRGSKIILSLRDKLHGLESEKVETVVKHAKLLESLSSLQQESAALQLKLDSANEKWKGEEQEKKSLEKETNELKLQIEQREQILNIRDEHINSLIRIVSEIDLSIKDIEKLVELGRSIAMGEEPSVSTLLGIDDLEAHLQNMNLSEKNNIETSCLNYDPKDPEWTLERLVKIRNIRKHLSFLRDSASDIYTDLLGGKVEGCNIT